MRLAVYQSVLVELLTQAEDLRVTEQDKIDIVRILGLIADYMWQQSSRAAIYATKQRRVRALQAVKLDKHTASPAFRAIPIEGADLFAGQLNSLLDSELAAEKRATETARQLKASTQPSSGRRFRFAGMPTGRRRSSPPPPPPRPQRAPQSSSRTFSRGRSSRFTRPGSFRRPAPSHTARPGGRQAYGGQRRSRRGF